MSKLRLLQLCPFSPWLEAELAQSFEVCQSFDHPDLDGWLQAHGAEVRAIATGGHIGAPVTLMENLPALGIVAINGVGFDKVDLDFTRARGIHVTTTPNALTNDVADLAIGLIIALLRGIVPSDIFVREGRWLAGERPLGSTVSGRTFGIVGLGAIGKAIAERLTIFGTVLYTDPHEKQVSYGYVPDLKQLAAVADVLILSSAATAATRHLINAEILAALGPRGYLVNVARGLLVDEGALIAALAEGRIAGAALDVFADEPRVPAELSVLPNVLLTPHIASATVETRHRMAELVLSNLRAFLAGARPPSALT